jgi:hypothetical protein
MYAGEAISNTRSPGLNTSPWPLRSRRVPVQDLAVVRNLAGRRLDNRENPGRHDDDHRIEGQWRMRKDWRSKGSWAQCSKRCVVGIPLTPRQTLARGSSQRNLPTPIPRGPGVRSSVKGFDNSVPGLTSARACTGIGPQGSPCSRLRSCAANRHPARPPDRRPDRESTGHAR